MREIKFRVFDTKQMKFLKIGDFIDETWRFNGVAGYGNIGVLVYKIIEKTLDSKLICDDNQFRITQFTGLKDCEGVEIYEGDIVQYGLCVEVVFYEPTMGRFMTELKKCNDESEIGEISSLSPYYTDNYEVIGNIYETPELLGGENG